MPHHAPHHAQSNPLPVLPTIRHVGVAHSVRWFAEGWALFVARPGFWLLAAVLQTLLFFLVSLVPILGQLGAHLLIPILSAGLMVVAARVQNQQPATIDLAFSGFREHPAVVNVGVWYMLGWVGIVALGLLLGGSATLSGFAINLETDYEWLGWLIGVLGVLLAVLLSLLLVLPLVMSVWLAPPLTVFLDIPAMAALRLSFVASWRSLPAFIVALLLVALMLFATALTFGALLLVAIPVMAGATYTAYHDLFVLPQTTGADTTTHDETTTPAADTPPHA